MLARQRCLYVRCSWPLKARSWLAVWKQAAYLEAGMLITEIFSQLLAQTYLNVTRDLKSVNRHGWNGEVTSKYSSLPLESRSISQSRALGGLGNPVVSVVGDYGAVSEPCCSQHVHRCGSSASQLPIQQKLSLLF